MRAGEDQRSTTLDLLERAVHVLRTAPVQVLLPYAIGTLPFLLGALYFHHAMGHRADALAQLPWASLVLAFLFIWMKYWHAIFAISLREKVSFRGQSPLGPRQRLRILLLQSVLQPAGLFLIPLSLIAVVPFPWVYGFFQGCTAQAGETAGLRESVARAAGFSGRCAGSNTRVLLLLAFFGLVVFLNVLSLLVLLPVLAKTLFGVDWQVTRNLMAMLNSTMLAVSLALGYLCLDPIAKSLFALRNFEFQSRHTGEDLLAELRGLRAAAAAFSVLVMLFFSIGSVCAQETKSPQIEVGAPTESATRVDQLGKAIQETLEQEKYSWRDPAPEKEGLLGRLGVSTFFEDIIRSVRKTLKNFFEWVEKAWRKIFPERSSPRGLPGHGWASGSTVLMWLLLSAVAAVLAISLMRWRQEKRKKISAAPIEVQPIPDVSDENIGPEQLPEDGWTRLGRELLAKGEHRLALRAFFLSGLALLGERQVITLARFKSNRDYYRELRRRAHEKADIVETFASTVCLFEAAWYGHQTPDEPAVLRVAEAVQSMRATL